MSTKLNPKVTRTTRQARLASPVESLPVQVATAEGGDGYLRTVQSELFLLAVTNFVGEDTFYEDGRARDSRFVDLCVSAARQDPKWFRSFVHWLRTSAFMRSAAVVAAAEGVYGRLEVGAYGGNRQIIDAALQRPDEPGDFLAYWTSKYGKSLPKPVRRGVADAVSRLYHERSFIKYDSARADWRFADVIAMTRPSTTAPKQDVLFGHILRDRHGRADSLPEIGVPILVARQKLLSMPVQERRSVLRQVNASEILDRAGFTWESLAGWLQGPMDAEAWSAIIPSMGVMALLRNLRNFDEAGVSDEVASRVIAKIIEPTEVQRARLLPMRVLSAYNAAPSDRWKHALAKTLDATLASLPTLTGRTLLLIDTSASMDAAFSKDGTLMRWDAAVTFGLALAKANLGSTDVVSFSGPFYLGEAEVAVTKSFALRQGASTLSEIQRWRREGYFIGGGTATAAAIRRHFNQHDRVIILTDEQVGSDTRDVDHAVPAKTPLYTWNLAGYRVGHAPSGTGNRHTFGGLSDAGFQTLAVLESMNSSRWPWEQ